MDLTLTQIIDQLITAKYNCEIDLKAEYCTIEERLFLSADLAQLKTAIGVLKELHDGGSDQFFNGAIGR